MNKHIEKMHNVLENYHKSVMAAQKKMAENTRTFQPDAAEEQNNRILRQMEIDRRNAESMIKEAQEEGYADAKAWAQISGEKISADAELLKYDLTSEQFNELAERHKNNGTMTLLLRQYAEKANAGSKAVKYDITMLHDEKAKRAAYDIYANGAMDLIDRISAPASFGSGASSEFVKMGVDNFGLPGSQLSQELSVLDE